MIKVLAVTGYKPFELGIFQQNHQGIYYIKKALEKNMKVLIEDGLEWVIVSGQLGVESWAAEVTIELQEQYPNLKLGVFTPFLEQEQNWNETNKENYELILSQADFVDSITKRTYDNPQQFRLKNHFFVYKSDALLIIYDDENKGSPAYMLETAQKRSEHENYPIIVINSFDLQSIVEEEQLKDPNFWSS